MRQRAIGRNSGPWWWQVRRFGQGPDRPTAVQTPKPPGATRMGPGRSLGRRDQPHLGLRPTGRPTTHGCTPPDRQDRMGAADQTGATGPRKCIAYSCPLGRAAVALHPVKPSRHGGGYWRAKANLPTRDIRQVGQVRERGPNPRGRGPSAPRNTSSRLFVMHSRHVNPCHGAEKPCADKRVYRRKAVRQGAPQ